MTSSEQNYLPKTPTSYYHSIGDNGSKYVHFGEGELGGCKHTVCNTCYKFLPSGNYIFDAFYIISKHHKAVLNRNLIFIHTQY